MAPKRTASAHFIIQIDEQTALLDAIYRRLLPMNTVAWLAIALIALQLLLLLVVIISMLIGAGSFFSLLRPTLRSIG